MPYNPYKPYPHAMPDQGHVNPEAIVPLSQNYLYDSERRGAPQQPQSAGITDYLGTVARALMEVGPMRPLREGAALMDEMDRLPPVQGLRRAEDVALDSVRQGGGYWGPFFEGYSEGWLDPDVYTPSEPGVTGFLKDMADPVSWIQPFAKAGAMAKGLKMAPVMGAVFTSRPWLRGRLKDILQNVTDSKTIAKAWMRHAEHPDTKPIDSFMKWSQATPDLPQPTFGVEREVRSILPARIVEDYRHDVPNDYTGPYLEDMLPEGLKTKADVSIRRGDANEVYRFPVEIETNPPLEGDAGVQDWAERLGPATDLWTRGGRHGEGGHVNLSWPGMEQEPALVPRMFEVFTENEPWITPSVPDYDIPGGRLYQYAQPSIARLIDPWITNTSGDELYRRMVNPYSRQNYAATAFDGKYNAFNTTGLNIPNPQRRRFEFRQFYEPETSEGWIENFLIARAMRDEMLRRGKHSLPPTFDEWMRKYYNTVLEPNYDEISKIQRQWWPSGVGIRPDDSPFHPDNPEGFLKPSRDMIVEEVVDPTPVRSMPDRSTSTTGLPPVPAAVNNMGQSERLPSGYSSYEDYLDSLVREGIERDLSPTDLANTAISNAGDPQFWRERIDNIIPWFEDAMAYQRSRGSSVDNVVKSSPTELPSSHAPSAALSGAATGPASLPPTDARISPLVHAHQRAYFGNHRFSDLAERAVSMANSPDEALDTYILPALGNPDLSPNARRRAIEWLSEALEMQHNAQPQPRRGVNEADAFAEKGDTDDFLEDLF